MISALVIWWIGVLFTWGLIADDEGPNWWTTLYVYIMIIPLWPWFLGALVGEIMDKNDA